MADEEEEELETEGQGGGVGIWDQCGARGGSNVAPNDIKDIA